MTNKLYNDPPKKLPSGINRTEGFQSAILDSANFTIISTDSDGVITFCNSTALNKLGYSADELVNRTTPIVIHDEQEIIERARQLSVELGREIKPGFEVLVVKTRECQTDQSDWTYVCKDGSRFRVRLSISTLQNKMGKRLGYLAIGQDITEKVESERRLQESENRFLAFMDHSPVMAFIKDPEGRMLFANKQLIKYFQKTETDLIGKLDHEIWPVEIAEQLRRNDLEVLNSKQALKVEEIVPTSDGTPATWLSVKFPFRTSDEQLCVAGLAFDISERKYFEQQLIESQARLEEAIARLEQLATQDALTGLNNRGAFDIRLADEFFRSRRYQLPMSLLLMDIDQFKRFNDEFGHPAGDACLQHVAELLNEHSRPSDFVARYGGEEFAIILANTPREGAMITAERIRQIIENSAWKDRKVTISIGVAELSTTHAEPAALLTAADKALYQAKKTGRNCVRD